MSLLRALLLTVALSPALLDALESAGQQFRNEDGLKQVAVSNGIEVLPSERQTKWTFIALLGARQPDGSVRWLCGGSLLSPRHVLTAAHCLVSVAPSQLVVRLGETRHGTTADGQHADRDVLRVVVHPERVGLKNDLAMLTLSAAVRQQPAQLGSVRPGQRATVAGWGVTRFRGRPSPVLLEADVTVTDPTECERLHLDGAAPNSLVRQLYPGGFGGLVLCATDLTGGGRDACRADSGGPLAVGPAGRQRLVAVVSSGRGCGDADLPRVYTDLSKYTNWIEQQLSDTPVFHETFQNPSFAL